MDAAYLEALGKAKFLAVSSGTVRGEQTRMKTVPHIKSQRNDYVVPNIDNEMEVMLENIAITLYLSVMKQSELLAPYQGEYISKQLTFIKIKQIYTPKFKYIICFKNSKFVKRS